MQRQRQRLDSDSELAPEFQLRQLGPGFSKQIGYVQVGSDGLNETTVTWGTPTVTAVH